jgi:hypothetical protein
MGGRDYLDQGLLQNIDDSVVDSINVVQDIDTQINHHNKPLVPMGQGRMGSYREQRCKFAAASAEKEANPPNGL